MPEFFDKEAGQVVKGTAAEAQQAYLQGRAGFKNGDRVNVVDQYGQLSNVPAESLGEALGAGYQIADDDLVQKARIQEKYGDQAVQAAAEGLARGVTFGLSDQALTGTGLADAEDLAGRQEANPTAAGAGELAGVVLPALATGGGSAAVQGAGAVARAGRAAGAAARATPAGALAKGAAAVERGVQAATGSRALALGASGAVEGAVVGAGQAISEAALHDVDLTAEQLLAGAGEGALLGAGAGAALGGAITGAEKTVQKIGDALGDKTRDWLSTLPGSAAFRAVKGPGGGKTWVEQAEALGGHGRVGEVALERGLIRPGDTVEKLAPRVQQEAARLRDEFFTVAKQQAPDVVEDAYDQAVARVLPKKQIKAADRFHGGHQKVARRVRELGVVSERSDYAQILETAAAVADEIGENIGKAVRRIDEAGLEGPTNARVHEILESQLADMVKSGSASQKRLAGQARRELESRGLMRKRVQVVDENGRPKFDSDGRPIMELEDPRRFTWQEFHQSRQALQREMGKYDVSTKSGLTDAYRKAATATEKHFEGLIDAVAPQLDDELVSNYKRLKDDFSAVKLYQDAAQEKVQAAAAKDNVDLGKDVREAFEKAHGVVTQKFDDAVRTADNAADLQKLRYDYQAVDLMRQAVEDATARAGANRNFSLTDNLMATVVGGDIGTDIAESFLGDIIGGGLGVAGVGLLSKQVRTRGAATVAYAANAAREISKRAMAADGAMDDAVRAFFQKPKAAIKRGVPRAAALAGSGSLRERFERSRDELGQVTPERVQETAAVRMEHNDLPMLTQAYAATAMRGADFLRSKLPQERVPAGLRPDLDTKQRVPDAEMRRYLRYSEAVRDPMSVVRSIEDGTVTREGAEALQAVYPRMFAQLVAKVQDAAADLDEDLSYERKRQLSIVLRTPLHPSMTGEYIAFAQSRYGDQKPGGGPAPSQQPVLAPSRRSAPNMAGGLATQSQRLEMDAVRDARS